MKILHTSDWHLGHTMNGFDRSAEHAAMLRRIAESVERHRPDAMVICGDIFHTPQPSAAAQTMLTDALMDFKSASPDTVIVSIAGNHDSPSKHDIFRIPWRRLGVYTFGYADTVSPAENIVAIPGVGFIAAVPYTHARNMPDDFFRTLSDTVNELNRDGLPCVLMAHTTVAGCDFTGHDGATALTAGGIDSNHIDSLGDAYDYIALGHIHRPQSIRGSRCHARYCGSALAVNFPEAYPHSISLVEIDSHGAPPSIAAIELPATVPLVTLPTSGFASWDTVCKLLREFPADIPAYIRLNVSDRDAIPADATMQAHRLCGNKEARFCRLNVEASSGNDVHSAGMTVTELNEMAPLDLAIRYTADAGIEFTEEMTSMFRYAERMASDSGIPNIFIQDNS